MLPLYETAKKDCQYGGSIVIGEDDLRMAEYYNEMQEESCRSKRLKFCY